MGKKATKATRKFAASGQLKKQIQARQKHQQIKRKVQGKKSVKDSKGKHKAVNNDEDDDEDEEEDAEPRKGAKGVKGKGMSVDDILGGGFMDEEDDDEDMGSEGEASDDEGGEDDDDNQSFASVDDLDDGEAHLVELSKLAEKDPEFYKYLQENDRELLDFNLETAGAQDDDSNDEQEGAEEDETMEEEDVTPILTTAVLKKWQKALLEQRSLRALRKLLLAFRSAAHMNEDGQVLAWTIDSSAVYNKLVRTTLKYTPVILEHHVPYKTLADGKFKGPSQSPKQKTLQKIVLSYFHNVIHILSQLTDNDTMELAVTESAKIIPYIVTSRKAVKLYLKKCLELWSSAEDNIRIAAFLAIRRLASSSDESIMDMVLKGTYLSLVRACKSTSAHNLPSINLMKNSASEIFCLDHATAYQHAFGYVRQLAIHLRNSMKVKTKEAYKQVYNWQYVHCVDFWSIVLGRACDTEAQKERGGEESDLKPLIYPLVQVSLGAIKLISNSRSYPFHLHIIRSLIHVAKHTQTYIPIPPYILPIITSTLAPSTRPKASTLRPLDFEVQIRAPQQYLKTRVYAEGLVEESSFLLAEWLATRSVQASIAFPEITVPLVVMLRKAVKTAKASSNSLGKDVGAVKGLVERIEDSARWVEQKRSTVTFAPGKLSEVDDWQVALKVEDSPMGKYVKVQRKTREKRRKLVEKARHGEDEILED